VHDFLHRVRTRWSSRPDEGASAVEYGMLVALVAAVVATVAVALGGSINDAFTAVNDQVAG
jgi:pilus assembly protein Flp/PilA